MITVKKNVMRRDGPGSSVRITSQQGSFTIHEGETITLVCSASCVPSCQFRWTCSGCRATRAAMLTIPSIQRDQSGTYTCLAYNNVSRGRADVTVHVLYPPSIGQLQFAEGGNTREVEVGQGVSISCQATGNPPPDTITWSVTGQPKPNQTFEMGYGHHRSSVYMLSSASCHDNDRYTCTAENSLGADVGSVHLKVLCPPIQSADSHFHGNGTQTFIAHFNSSANFTACVIARPLPIVRWYHVILDVMTPVLAYDVIYHDITARVITSVSVTTAEAENYGLYRVEIENEKGAYVEMFSLVAKEAPQPPYNLTITNITMTSFCMTWLPAFDGGAPQTFVMTYYTQNDDKVIIDLNPRDVTMKHCLEGLLEDTMYYVTLQAENEYGRSRETTVNFTTFDDMTSQHMTSQPRLLGFKVGVALGGALLLFLVVSLALVYRRRHLRGPREKRRGNKQLTPLCIINENVRLSYLDNGQGNYVDAASATHDVTCDCDVSGEVTGGTGLEVGVSWLLGNMGRRLGVEDLSRRPSSTSSANIYMDVLGEPSTYINQGSPEECHGSTYMNAEKHAEYDETAEQKWTGPTQIHAQLSGAAEGYVDMSRLATNPVVTNPGDIISAHDATNSDDVNPCDDVNMDYDDAWCVTTLPVLGIAEAQNGSSSLECFSSDGAAPCQSVGRSLKYSAIPTITVTQDEEGATADTSYHVYDVTDATDEEEHIYDVIMDSDLEN